MTSGIQSHGTDLDSIFAPYVTGAPPPKTGILVAGKDIYNRYAPRVYGTQAPATLIETNGTDLNQLFAAYGTTQYTLPINGVTYKAICEIPSGGSGESQVSFGFSSTSTYFIKTYTTYGPTSPYIQTYSFAVPAGVDQVIVTPTYVAGDTGSQVTVYNNASSLTPISTSVQSYLTVGPWGATSGTHYAQYMFQIQFAQGSSIIFTGTATFYAETDGSV